MRWIVWVNGVPLLLGPGVEPTEDVINAGIKRLGFSPLDPGRDEIDAITQAGPNFVSQFEWARKYYPGGYTILDELAEATDERT